MKKLNQIVAIEKGVRSRTQETLTNLHQACQKAELFRGHTRTYEPTNSEGETFPAENVIVKMRSDDVIDGARTALIEQIDIVAAKDFANCNAKADVVVDGVTLVANAPVPFILYLEKELVALHTFINKLPELDPSHDWTRDDNIRLWKSAVVKSVKTKKVQDALVLLAPTKEHPGQAKDITVDKTVGYWSQTEHSGAMPATEKNKLLNKVHLIMDATKQAREQANLCDATDMRIGKKIMDWLFA